MTIEEAIEILKETVEYNNCSTPQELANFLEKELISTYGFDVRCLLNSPVKPTAIWVLSDLADAAIRIEWSKNARKI